MTEPRRLPARQLLEVAPTYYYVERDPKHNDAIDHIVAERMARGDHVHLWTGRGDVGTLCLNPEETRCKFDGTDPGSDPVKDRKRIET